MIRIILKSALIAIELITLLTDIESCMPKRPGLLELLICLGTARSSIAYDSNILGTFDYESVTIKI